MAQADARVVSTSEVEEIVELAMAASDDPLADALEALAQDGLHVERINGAWVVETGRSPLRAAARVATLLGPGCVLARKGAKTIVLLWHGKTLAMADSGVPRWRIYPVTPPSTPQSIFAGGLSPATATR
ncbi:hypothetical protein FXN61_32170 [Lentzea sp. PSKA42]|uniref:Uncharacterized protein n=1 Tax=Lentzea indica TaxID=2604800 RepID=A0ABX1FQ94_9PSEU|nr:hypothetical protein [Lentzea indica]NKE61180.1 hypothetical protein [Lentzea indica]